MNRNGIDCVLLCCVLLLLRFLLGKFANLCVSWTDGGVVTASFAVETQPMGSQFAVFGRANLPVSR